MSERYRVVLPANPTDRKLLERTLAVLDLRPGNEALCAEIRARIAELERREAL